MQVGNSMGHVDEGLASSARSRRTKDIKVGSFFSLSSEKDPPMPQKVTKSVQPLRPKISYVLIHIQ